MDFFSRYRIESRATGGKNFKTVSWLVVYDKESKEYIKEGRGYKKFSNSEEIVKYFSKKGLDK